MEDIKIYKVEELASLDLTYKDLRQTAGWSEFLKTLGWKSYRTPSGINVEIIDTLFMKVGKVQRPLPMTGEQINEIDEVSKQHNLVFVKIEPHLRQDITLLKDSGYIDSFFPLIPPSTVFIDLTKTDEELWENLSKSAKYSINRAKREGVRIEIVKNPSGEDVEKFQKLANSTGIKKKFYVPTLAENKKKAELFGDMCFLAFSYDKTGELTGAKFHIGNEHGVWYLHGGTSDAGQKDKSGYLLTWETVLYFKGLGFRVFDLEGVMDPRFPLYTMNWDGLTHFKRKFNGYEVRFSPPQIKIFNKYVRQVNSMVKLPL